MRSKSFRDTSDRHFYSGQVLTKRNPWGYWGKPKLSAYQMKLAGLPSTTTAIAREFADYLGVSYYTGAD